MVYRCEICNYVTDRKCNYLRHINRKRSCVNTNNGNNEYTNNENNTNTQNGGNIHYNRENLNDFREELNGSSSKFECEKCKKILCDKRSYLYHINICKGVNSKTCHICLKEFSSSQGKHNHLRNVKCQPVVRQEVVPQTVNNNNNITNNNITNNTTINNTTNNNNLTINVFGQENIEYLYNDKRILDRLKTYGKKGIYGFSKILEEVYFNRERPENNTLIKPEEHGNSVMIMNEDQEWEYREMEDIQDEMIDIIVRYFKAYNKVKNDMNIKLIEKRERNIIKNFAYEFMALDGYIPRELFEEIEMDEDDIETNEEEIRKKVRKFVKSTMKTVYNRTIDDYRKEKGKYIRV